MLSEHWPGPSLSRPYSNSGFAAVSSHITSGGNNNPIPLGISQVGYDIPVLGCSVIFRESIGGRDRSKGHTFDGNEDDAYWVAQYS
jgi:hypothetical protein